MPAATTDPLLAVEDLRVDFTIPGTVVHAVRGLSYTVGAGEAVGLVGESGSGKSVSGLALLGLLPKQRARISSGSVKLRGRELIGLSEQDLREIRATELAMVFQDPLSSLNPRMTVGRQIGETLQAHRHYSRAAAHARAVELLDMVGIAAPNTRVNSYPHQFSGGMRQRVMLAIAISCEPAILIADEPTTALDVTIQAQMLDLLRRLRRELNMAVLLITHDLGVVAGLTDRLAVMYAGRLVESGATAQVLSSPQHPYTMGLLRSVPRLDQPRSDVLLSIDGGPPDPTSDPPGCPFEPRCAYRTGQCIVEDPPMEPVAVHRQVACWVKPAYEKVA
jgi:oligopeptide/dipeptide ABC transporter ATP-binding protein